jgi:hypothetical protein
MRINHLRECLQSIWRSMQALRGSTPSGNPQEQGNLVEITWVKRTTWNLHLVRMDEVRV